MVVTPVPEVLMLVVPVTVKPERVPREVKEEVTTVALRVVPVKVPAAAVTVISADPLNDTPLMFLAVCRVVAVEALPVRGPVKPVEVNIPVDGLKVNLVEETFCERLPVVEVTQVG